jgi:hypothetical protein
MTMHFYHNKQFILKIYSYKTFFKQGSDETLFCIAFARFVDSILNNSGIRIALFLSGDMHEGIYI